MEDRAGDRQRGEHVELRDAVVVAEFHTREALAKDP